jgi:hypothetical protein
MTKSRTPSALFALTIGAAVALGGVTPAEAYYNKIAFNYASTRDGKSSIDDLPVPPQLVAPKAEPHRSRPPTVTFAWGSTAPVLRKPATPPGIKSLKSK